MFRYKTVVFDLDGTLFKTDSTFIRALNDVCESMGIAPLEHEATIRLIGMPMIQICKRIFGDGISDSQIEQIRNDVRKRQQELLPRTAVLYDNVELLLSKLREDGYTLCLCSTGSRQYVDMILNHFHIVDIFSVIKAFTEGISKSQQIRQILEETASGSAIVVGDTKIDMDAAADAGCISIGASYGYGDLSEYSADIIAREPMDVYHLIQKINSLFHTVSTQLTQRKRKGHPLFVGINGADTSGKTVFSKQMGRYLTRQGFAVETIHMDDFLNPSHIRNQDADPVLSYYANAFNTRMLVDEVLEPASACGCLDKELLMMDLGTDSYAVPKRIHIDYHTIVLIEGVLLFRSPVDDYLGYRIYLHIPFDEVIKRALARDTALFGGAAETERRYREKYIPVQKLYMDNETPMEKSDAVIDNENYLHAGVVFRQESYRPSGGDGIQLTPITEAHLPFIRNMEQDPASREMLGISSEPSMPEYSGNNNRCYAILEGNAFIGVIELMGISWKNRRAELSVDIEPSHRGRGYGYRAIMSLLDIGFNQLGLNRIWLRVLENNESAVRLYRKCGFVEEGTLREESLRSGRFANQVAMSMLKREWIEIATEK